ncbi:MAG: phenylacetate-CoA oxygenase subunit PaaJ [Bacteroidetes bacterium]|nr:phenylacetate-CoA oxygenase subunit PaaJ [Bacteroidota bacterium]MBS1633140.1 phenylacetate-CoA oxygenase subunit PaaJ [Bacteroidota bacterium]
MNTSTEISEKKIRSLLEEVKDPEVPVLSVLDLGIVREINLNEDGIEIKITPTFSACPAMDVIRINIEMVLTSHGYKNVKVVQVLSPAWTTDWMSEEGKRKLKEYGIAPPNPKQQVCHQELFVQDEAVQCPRCDSYHTHRVSEFGSTPCKALYVCDNCKEPFEYFKSH